VNASRIAASIPLCPREKLHRIGSPVGMLMVGGGSNGRTLQIGLDPSCGPSRCALRRSSMNEIMTWNREDRGRRLLEAMIWPRWRLSLGMGARVRRRWPDETPGGMLVPIVISNSEDIDARRCATANVG
jgi:hypothetical protein